MKRPSVGVAVVFLNDGKILLGKRKNSHGEGLWATPGGYVELGETCENAAKREAYEETGLLVHALKEMTWVEHIEGLHHSISFFFLVDIFEGTPEVKEKEKCEEWVWFDLKNLPSNLFPPLSLFLKKSSFPIRRKDQKGTAF